MSKEGERSDPAESQPPSHGNPHRQTDALARLF